MSIDAPIPPVPMWRLFLKMGGWMVVIFGVILLVVTLISHLALETAKRFEREGLPATATVAGKYITESRDSDGDINRSYWLTLEYVTQAGDEIQQSRTVGTSVYRGVEKGETLEILYLESAPDKTEVTPGSNRSASRVTQIVALVLGLVWLGTLWLVGGWAVAAVRARRYGPRQQARLQELRRTAIRVNGQPRYRLVWTDNAGRTGESLLRRKSDLAGLSPGDRIAIYQGVKYAWWVGDVGEREEFLT